MAPIKKLSAREALDAILESSDEDENFPSSFSDSDVLYEPSLSDDSDSSMDTPSSPTVQAAQSPAPVTEPSSGVNSSQSPAALLGETETTLSLSSPPCLDKDQNLPGPISMEWEDAGLPSTDMPCDSESMQQNVPELGNGLIEELPLPPILSPLPPLSDNEDFPLPPPPSPLPPLPDNDDFIYPLPPSPLKFTTDTATPKNITRKRKRNEQEWKRKAHSKDHNTGKKKLYKGEECREECQRKCTHFLTNLKRQQIFESFWGMNSKQGRRDFVVSHVNEIEKKRSVGRSDKRKKTLIYMLPFEGASIQVCKTMFLSTLGVSDIMVLYNLKQSVCNVVKPKPKPEPKNKIPQDKIDVVHAHIRSFPKVDSHYCRADTQKKYLDATLNIRQMYRLYCQQQNNENCVSEHKYRDIFNSHYNLSFHHPSKDTCDTCTKFIQKSSTEEEKRDQEAHLRRKCQARDNKNADKLDQSKVVAAFDLQQVISCPKLSVSSAYYFRKLNIYNFTILNLQSLQGDCYTWTENECNGYK